MSSVIEKNDKLAYWAISKYLHLKGKGFTKMFITFGDHMRLWEIGLHVSKEVNFTLIIRRYRNNRFLCLLPKIYMQFMIYGRRIGLKRIWHWIFHINAFITEFKVDLFLHDNAPAQKFKLITIRDLVLELLEHSPYLLYLAPSNQYFFP